MAQARCPHCSRVVEVPDCLTVGLLLCPGCTQGYFYQGGALPEPAPPLVPIEEDEPETPPVTLAEPVGHLLAALLAEPVRDLPLVAITQPPSPSAEVVDAILAAPVRTTLLPRQPPTRIPTPPPTTTTSQPRPTLLLAPHLCQHCHRPLPDPIERSKATPECPHCHNLTSAYALHFRCERCDVLLEAPSRIGGTDAPCPGCGATLGVPRLVLLERAPWPGDPEFYSCECPSCQRRLIARREEAGQRAACPHCRIVITVPSHGTALPSSALTNVVHSRQGTRTERTVVCRTCGFHIPAAAGTCPMCLAPYHPSDYPGG